MQSAYPGSSGEPQALSQLPSVPPAPPVLSVPPEPPVPTSSPHGPKQLPVHLQVEEEPPVVHEPSEQLNVQSAVPSQAKLQD